MKRITLTRMFSILLSILLVCTMLTACGGGASKKPESSKDEASVATSDETFTLTCSNFYASTHEMSVLVEQWIAAIEERTDGRVQIDYFPGESLVTAGDTVNAVQQGIVDIGIADVYDTAGVFPAMSVAAEAWGYPDGYVSTMVVNDYAKNFADLPEFSNMHFMYSHAVPPLIFMTNKEIRTYEDFTGAIVRIPGESVGKIVKNIGAQAYSCSITELYEALSKGICTSAVSGWDALSGFNLQECLKYVLVDPSFGELGIPTMWMNKDVWNKLPADIQEIITETNAEWVEKHAMTWKYLCDIAAENFLALGEGREILYLSEEDSAKLAAATAAAYEEFNANVNLSADELTACTDYLKNCIDEWSAKTVSSENCAAFFAETVAPDMLQ